MSANIRTSRKWVLPSRPRPGRKPADHNKGTSCVSSSAELTAGISAIACENTELKTHLLALIYDYKALKHLVLDSMSSPIPADLVCNTERRKRSFTELGGDPINKLISDMNDLSHNTPLLSPNDPASPHPEPEPINEEPEEEPSDNEMLSFLNLDLVDRNTFPIDEESEPESDADDEHLPLSRTTSPSMSENEANSLMTSLTRSTTVSTTNLFLNDRKPNPAVKFYDLPSYAPSDYKFSFDTVDHSASLMSIIQEDKYNMVTDFLEEKLIDNDLDYYVQNETLR